MSASLTTGSAGTDVEAAVEQDEIREGIPGHCLPIQIIRLLENMGNNHQPQYHRDQTGK